MLNQIKEMTWGVNEITISREAPTRHVQPWSMKCLFGFFPATFTFSAHNTHTQLAGKQCESSKTLID